MGNFEKLSVLVIVVIIVMILVVALYTWTDNPDEGTPAQRDREVSDLDDRLPPPDKEPADGPRNLLEEWEREFNREGEGEAKGDDPDTPGIVEPPVTPTPDPLPDPKPEPEKDEPVSSEPWMYTVKPGDTLTEIAERELGTWKRYREILKLNTGVTAASIRPGDTLKMPARELPKDPMASSKKETPGATPVISTTRTKPKPGDHYVIRQGDRLSKLSKWIYGKIDRWPEIWARNLSVIDDPDDPPVGAKILLPK